MFFVIRGAPGTRVKLEPFTQMPDGSTRSHTQVFYNRPLPQCSEARQYLSRQYRLASAVSIPTLTLAVQQHAKPLDELTSTVYHEISARYEQACLGHLSGSGYCKIDCQRSRIDRNVASYELSPQPNMFSTFDLLFPSFWLFHQQ